MSGIRNEYFVFQYLKEIRFCLGYMGHQEGLQEAPRRLHPPTSISYEFPEKVFAKGFCIKQPSIQRGQGKPGEAKLDQNNLSWLLQAVPGS